MLHVLFDFVVAAWSDPLGAGISGSRAIGSAQGRLFAENAKEWGTDCVGNDYKIEGPSRALTITFMAFSFV